MAPLAVALGFAAVAWRGLPRAVDLLDYPFALDYGEGVVISQVRHLAESGDLYPVADHAGASFVGANYPPFYYLLIQWTRIGQPVSTPTPASGHLSATWRRRRSLAY